MAAPKKSKVAPKKATVVDTVPVAAIDSVLEAQNLILEVEQAEQDIKDIIEHDMIRANAEHEAILKANARESDNIKHMNVHMSGKLIKMADECLRRSKVGVIDGRHRVLLDLMFEYDKVDNK